MFEIQAIWSFYLRLFAVFHYICKAWSFCHEVTTKNVAVKQAQKQSCCLLERTLSLWENELSVLFCNCSAQNILTPNENGFTCWNCCEKCIVARPCCCREENPKTYFTVFSVSTKTICPLFKTNMNYLICCKELVAVSIKNDIINCVKYHKLFIECHRKFLNALPFKKRKL